MDHSYTKVIQTFAEIIKRNASDRQILLVNMARALKYPEAYGQRQSQLFTVLKISPSSRQSRRLEVSISLPKRSDF